MLLDESDNYPDNPSFSWVLKVKDRRRYDFDYKQHIGVVYSANYVPGRDLYIGLNCLEINKVIHPYRLTFIDCPNPSSWTNIVYREISLFTTNCRGTYHYSTFGTGAAPTSPNFSDLWNYIYFTNAEYTWYAIANQTAYNLLNDLVAYLSAKGAYSDRTSMYTGAFQAYEYRYDIHKIMDKASLLAKLAPSWTLEEVNNFEIQSGLGAEIFNNMFLNKPRNCTVAQELTEEYWQNEQLFSRLIIFKCEIPSNLTRILNLAIPVGYGSPIKYYVLLVESVSNFIQYKDRRQFLLDNTTLERIAAELRTRLPELVAQYQMFVAAVHTSKSLSTDKTLHDYLYGITTPGTYVAQEAADEIINNTQNQAPTEYFPTTASDPFAILIQLLRNLYRKLK